MMLNLFQGAIKRSAEGSTCQRCSNIPSRNVSSAYFICRPNDVAVKEAYTLLLDQLEQSNASQERVDKLDQSSEPTPKEEGKYNKPISRICVTQLALIGNVAI
ncbi:uncharacterized protein LOC134191532 [Corticium candelabrum]|uniref:uncharacterized protein LOC134191532 n=1 Tax=Corticium candelabrum TaxID=121492 RepID=UPI002E2695A9|nr:uncharacterized protein LOC134191532 [Corticium candelabrum]